MKSAIEMRIKEYIKTQGLTNRRFAKDVGMGESTLYKKWREPQSFTEFELRRIANVLGINYEQASALCVETKNRDSIQAEQQIESIKGFHIRSGVLLVMVVLGVVLLSLVLHLLPDTKLGKGERLSLPEYRARYIGAGVDLAPSDLGEETAFHSSLYDYEFLDITVETLGEDISLTGKMRWTLKRDSTLTRLSDFSAEGKHLGDTAALVYTVKDPVDSEVWIGTAMMYMPRSGDANGYWMTIHNDKDPAGTGPFAIGTIELTRREM